MIAPHHPCDRSRLQRLLDDQLADADQTVVTEHVAGCETCRTQLEELAAERSWWREAARQLRSGEWREDGTLRLASSDQEPLDLNEDSDHEASWITSLDFLEPCDNPAMLGRLGSYDILEVIGSGGFGIVLKGYDRELNRYVAVKVLAPHLAHSAAARKRFAREAQAAAAIVHPHVVPIHAVNAAGTLPYLVMPFIAGESLQQRLDRFGPLELKEILRIGMQTALGLAAAHAQGLVHRDIKPANILLEHGVDRVMLTDFGLARAMDDASLTRSTVIAGTPQYMSPEQARGDGVDHRTDLFSLGSVMYAMCAGYPPFRAETMLGVLRRVSEDSPRSVRELNADVPEWMSAIIDQLLAKAASKRFQSAAEIANLLERCLAHVQQPTVLHLPAELAVNSATATRRRRRIGLLVVAAAAILVWIGYGVAKWSGRFWSNVQNGLAASAAPAGDSPAVVPSELNQAESNPAAESSGLSPASEESPPARLDWNDTTDRELLVIGAMLERLEE